MMTAKTKKATVAAVALTFVAVFLAYSALAAPAPASAQTAATASTSSSSAASTPTSPPSNSNAPPGPGQWMVSTGPGGFGRGGPFKGGQMRGGYGAPQQEANLTVGQTITISSTQGEYLTGGSTPTNGTASGSVTFTVTGKLSEGYTLSIASGTIVVNGTTYTLSSGTAQMDGAATTLTGQGTTTPSGSFIIQASARGSFVGSVATVSLDLGAGSSEYLVVLTGTVGS